jgi:hypothetical protein
MRLRPRIGLIAAAALFAAAAVPAHACSVKHYHWWWPWEKEADQKRHAEQFIQTSNEDVLFVGMVKSVEVIALSRLDSANTDVELVELIVTGVLKGYTFDHATIRIRSHRGGECGWEPVAVGQQIFVAANRMTHSSDLEPIFIATDGMKRNLLAAYKKRGIEPKAP